MSEGSKEVQPAMASCFQAGNERFSGQPVIKQKDEKSDHITFRDMGAIQV